MDKLRLKLSGTLFYLALRLVPDERVRGTLQAYLMLAVERVIGDLREGKWNDE